MDPCKIQSICQNPGPSTILSIRVCAEKKSTKGKGKPKKHAELFCIASASETIVAPGIPGWRIALGNIAAGATAGATVEAGGLPFTPLTHRRRVTCRAGSTGFALERFEAAARYIDNTFLYLALVTPLLEAADNHCVII